MTTQVALLEAEERQTLSLVDTPPLPIPIDVTVLGEDKVQLSQGGPFPYGVTFDAETGALSIPSGYFQVNFTIVTAGASFKNLAIAFEPEMSTYIGLSRTSLTTAAIPTLNGLPLGAKVQANNYTLLCVGPTGMDEPHDPTIIYEPPGG